jgi:GH25 family lysozyme M1 (1,4-beta-N-acetylmuramidase)
MSRQRSASDGGGVAHAAAGWPLWGVDVASYQHPDGAPIDWPKVAAAGYTFASVKATEENSYVNPYYFSDVAGARAAGLSVTAYHFGIPNVSGGASQARSFVAHSGYRAGNGILPPELDIEYNPSTAADADTCYGLTPAQMVSWITAYDTEVQRLTGQAPIIFTSANWWDFCTANSTAFGSHLLWAAADAPANPVTSSPPLPAGWGDWFLWRYTGGGHVPGIPADVDVSMYNPDPVTLIDPGTRRSTRWTRISLEISSLNKAAGQSLTYLAIGLPPGLTISGSGQILGRVSAAPGTYDVSVTATNPLGATGTTTFTWVITGQLWSLALHVHDDAGVGPAHR